MFDNLPKKIRDKIEPIPETDCWIWTGSYYWDQPCLGGKGIHRMVMGEPKGMSIIRSCPDNACVNPKHLLIVKRGTGSAKNKNTSIHAKGPIRRNHGGITCYWTEKEWEKVKRFRRTKREQEDRFLASRFFGRMKSG